MTTNQGHDHPEWRVPMPEMKKTAFITEQTKLLNSALLEAQNQGNDPSQSEAKPLIQRVSPVLINIKEEFKKCFKPRLVALGPLHHDDNDLKRAEHSKLKLAALFAHFNERTAVALFQKIMAEINYLKSCYNPEDIQKYDDEKLAWMLFVDGSAVLYTIHLGMKDIEKLGKLNIKSDLLAFAQLDLFLLENQIPYRVLQILIDSTQKPELWEKLISDFIDRNQFTNVEGGQNNSQHSSERSEKDGKIYAHLLHRLRESHLRTATEKRNSSCIGKMLLWCGHSRKERKTFRSIKELKESGVNLAASRTNNLKGDISFYCNFLGTLRMPRILVDDSTASKFMNLVALEMCRDFNNGFEITTYLCFLDSLIDKADDVKELRVTGMLHNYLGSDEEVAELFNRMSRDLVPDQELYAGITSDIIKYVNNPLTTTVAQAYYTHFSSPWTFIAFLGAIVSLLFSATQAYFALPGNKS